MLTAHQLANFAKASQLRRTRTPYMLTDLHIIQQKCKEFRAHFPSVKLYFALKSFSDSEVAQYIDRYIDGYDMASIFEIEAMLKLGVRPERLTFSNPVKSESAIRRAARLGVDAFAFQSYNELVKIKKNAPGSRVYLRLAAYDAKGGISLSAKFGAERHSAAELLLAAKALGLKVKGLTFHVGSQAVEPEAWSEALDICGNVANEVSEHGIKLAVINIGGGFPVQYSNRDPLLDEVAHHINPSLHSLKKQGNYEFMAEPGRFLVADSSAIVSTVISVEERFGKTWLFLDVGVFQAFMETLELNKFMYPVFSLDHVLKKTPIHAYKDYVLTGPSCDAFDTMSLSVSLPEDIAIGSKLMITMAGAYTVVYGSPFNGFKIPERYFINSGSARKL